MKLSETNNYLRLIKFDKMKLLVNSFINRPIPLGIKYQRARHTHTVIYVPYDTLRNQNV